VLVGAIVLGSLAAAAPAIGADFTDLRVRGAIRVLAATGRARPGRVELTSLQYQPMGDSFRLMWTCLTCKYSSAPQGPSSRPMPDIL
jgi:hypothetical protein